MSKMLECQFCREEWPEKDLMDREGLSHFLTPNTKRKVVETSGHVWEVVFNATGVERVEQCRKCPIILGEAETC